MMKHKHILAHYMRSIVIAVALLSVSSPASYAEDCKEAKTLQDMDKQNPKCKVYNKDKTIRDCIQKADCHHVPPLKWMAGQRPNESDPAGNAMNFGLIKPGTPTAGGLDGSGNPGGQSQLPQNPFGGGGPGGGGGGGTPTFPPGAGGCDKNGDGVDDRDDLNNDGVPDYLDQCTTLGEVTASPTGTSGAGQCGAGVEVESTMMSVTANQNAAIYANTGTSQIEAYRINGNNQVYVSSSPVPEFYCRVEVQQQTDPVTGQVTVVEVAVKEFITPDTQSHAVSNNTRHLAVGMSDADTGAGVIAGGGFITMTRQGSSLNFEPPPPNANELTARGVLNVDPNCYTEEYLFKPIPSNFGGIILENLQAGYCEMYHHSPDEPGCEGYLHYINRENMTMYYEPGSTIRSGRVTGGSRDGTAVIMPTLGNFVTDTSGNVTYTGSTMYMRQDSTFALGISNGVNEQTFIDGARLEHPSGYRIIVNAPGRIRVYSDGRVQLLDGGETEAPDGTTLNIIAPSAAVQFPHDEVIFGQSLGRVVVNSNNPLPAVEPDGATQPSIKVQSPYDTTIDPCAAGN